jgi:hypothetical protein
MPLSALFNGMWYGEASLAVVMSGVGAASGTAGGTAGLTASLAGAGALSASMLRMRNMNITAAGSGVLAGTLAGAAALRCTISIGSRPTADDVAQAVLNSFKVEGGMGVSDVLRVLLAVAAGKTDISGTGPTIVTFRNLADTKDRVRAAMTGSERGSVTVDGA